MVQIGLVSTWLLICAVRDYHTGEVPNWLTLPTFFVVLILRILGALSTPWWSIVAISVTVVYAWHRGLMGGADTKGWLTFAVLGDLYIVVAAIGMTVWLLAVKLAARKMGARLVRIEGFPGYFLGMLWMFSIQVL